MYTKDTKKKEPRIFNTIIANTSVLSEEEALKLRDLEDNSQYHHSERKGCTFKESIEKSRRGYLYMKYICLKHLVICCSCGWEMGKHYGTISNQK